MSDRRRVARELRTQHVDGFKLTERQAQVNKLLGSTARHILIFGGGRSGKTFLICRAIVARALKAPGSRHAILRHRFNHVVNSIGGDAGTLAVVLALCFPGVGYRVDRVKWVFTLANGSEIWLLGLDEKNRTEKILGMEFASLYFNETSQIKWSAIKMARSRLVQKAPIAGKKDQYLALKAYYDLNPAGKSHYTYQIWIRQIEPETNDTPLRNPERYKWDVMNPQDNIENLSPEAIEELESLPESERARFLEGRYVDEVDGALWKAEWISRNRVDQAEDLQQIVVSFDPSGSAAGDEVGIVVSGRRNNDYYVLADHSAQMSPTQAARKAIQLYDDYQADALVWETNFGKEWVATTIRATARDMHALGERDDDNVVLQDVTVFRGKVLRAAPVADLYSLDRVHHMGTFRSLEDEMTSFTYDWDRAEHGSPNRLDAAVMAVTHLAKSAPSQQSIGFGKVRFGR